MTCKVCKSYIPEPRFRLGYWLCMPCGEAEAQKVKHTVVPMHKSNYVVVTDREVLKQLTRPGRTLEG